MRNLRPAPVPTVRSRQVSKMRCEFSVEPRMQYSQLFEDVRWDDGPTSFCVQYCYWLNWESGSNLFWHTSFVKLV